MSALQVQEGGGHYKDMPIQPVEYIHANKLPFIEGAIIKYVSRWRNKNGIEDLKKARHFIDLLIELETRNKEAAPVYGEGGGILRLPQTMKAIGIDMAGAY